MKRLYESIIVAGLTIIVFLLGYEAYIPMLWGTIESKAIAVGIMSSSIFASAYISSKFGPDIKWEKCVRSKKIRNLIKAVALVVATALIGLIAGYTQMLDPTINDVSDSAERTKLLENAKIFTGILSSTTIIVSHVASKF